MGIPEDADRIRRERNARSIAKTMGTFKVATVSPDDFTVYLDGAEEASPAEQLQGQMFSVDDTGIYWLVGQIPYCGRIA